MENEGIPFWGYIEYRESETSTWEGFAKLNFHLDFGNGFDFLEWRGMPTDVSILFLLDNSIVYRQVVDNTQAENNPSNLVARNEAEMLQEKGKAILIDTGSRTYIFHKKLRISWAYTSELEAIRSNRIDWNAFSSIKLKSAIQMMKSLNRGHDSLSRMIYWNF